MIMEEEFSKTVEIKDLEIPENFEKQYAYTIKIGDICNQYDLYHPGQL